MELVPIRNYKVMSPEEYFNYSKKDQDFDKDYYAAGAYKSLEKMQKISRGRADLQGFTSEEGLEYIRSEFIEQGQPLATISVCKAGSCLSGGELWKFGFIKDGKIYLVCNGEYLARGRDMAIKTYSHLMQVLGEPTLFAAKN